MERFLYKYKDFPELDSESNGFKGNVWDIFKDNMFYFPKPEQLNDPFDSKFELVQHYYYLDSLDKYLKILGHSEADVLEIKSKISILEVQEIIKQTAQSSFNFVRLVAFSKTKYNILLWAHYANSHKGIAIEFETPFCKNFFMKSNYLDVVYQREYPKLNWFEDSEPVTRVVVGTKSVEWAYEEEARMWASTDPNLKTNPYPLTDSTKRSFNPLALRAVYFGLQVENNAIDKFKEEIIKLGKYPHIEYYKAKKWDKSFALKFDKC